MSIESMFSSDAIVAGGRTLDCRVVSNAPGKKHSHRIYFASDPKISPNEQLLWTKHCQRSADMVLRAVTARGEGRPGEVLLWIVEAHEE